MFNKRILLGIAILAGIIASAVGFKIYKHRAFASEVDEWFKGVPGISYGERVPNSWTDQVTYRDVRFSAFGATDLRANEIVVYSDEGPPERPERMHALVRGFSLNLTDSEIQGAGPLRSMGLSRLQGDLEIDGEASADLKELRFQMALSFDQLFAVKTAAHLYDLEISQLSDFLRTTGMPDGVNDARISYMSLAYEDHSLLARALQGQPLKPEMTVQLAMASNPRLQHISGFRDAATAFLKRPTRLELVIAPEQPVRFGDLQDLIQREPERLHMQLKYQE